MVNIAFAWWGTWWHVFPIKSLIEYIRKDNNLTNIFNKIYWFGEDNSLEQKVANAMKVDNCEFVEIVSWKIRREKSLKWLIKNFFDIFKFIYWIFHSIYMIWYYKIDIIFCKGWYVAGPIVFAWWLLRKKIFLHESDTVPWVANVFASKFSTLIFTWFPNVLKNPIVVWQILSDQLLSYINNSSVINDLDINIDMSKTNILVMWWSQGSKTIYDNLCSLLSIWNYNDFNFIVILGTQNIGLKDKFANYKNVVCLDFVTQSQMWYLCSISDVWVTRWWATSLAEQKLFNMKLIIIPLPYTWGNHQYFNWVYYKEKFEDILIKQDNNLFSNFADALDNIKWFKKSNKWLPEVDSAKKIIFENILSHI